MKSYTVLLVEDETDTREYLAKAINSHSALELTSAVGTFSEAKRMLNECPTDVLLTDLGLPDGDGLDLIIEIGKQNYRTETMVITVFGDEKHVLSAIEAGASSYLLKDESANQIGDSIVQMMKGASPISPSIARHLLKRFRIPHPVVKQKEQEIPKLTPKESEILNFIAKGFSFTEVANILTISQHTVAHHVKNIYRKLAVRSRAEAVYEAMQLGIVQVNKQDNNLLRY